MTSQNEGEAASGGNVNQPLQSLSPQVWRYQIASTVNVNVEMFGPKELHTFIVD